MNELKTYWFGSSSAFSTFLKYFEACVCIDIDSFKHRELFNLLRFNFEDFLPCFCFFWAEVLAFVVAETGCGDSWCIDNSFSLLMLDASCDRNLEICVSLRHFVSGSFMLKDVLLIELFMLECALDYSCFFESGQ